MRNITGQNMKDEWDARAKIDPLNATVNSKGPGEWDLQEYFQTGNATVQQILDLFDTVYPNVDLSELTCLEIGGGAGRLTQVLADLFDQVIYLDVSPEMMEAAQKNLAELGKENVTFLVGSGENLAVTDHVFEFVFSVIVFQHMTPKYQYANLKDAAKKLANGGYMAIHMYGNQEEYAQLQEAWEARRQANDLMGWSEAARAELERYETGIQHAVDQGKARSILEKLGMEVFFVKSAWEQDYVIIGRKL